MKYFRLGVRCQESGVRCQVSGVRCHISPVICHMSLMQTAMAKDPPSDNSPNINKWFACKDRKTNLLFFCRSVCTPFMSKNLIFWQHFTVITCHAMGWQLWGAAGGWSWRGVVGWCLVGDIVRWELSWLLGGGCHLAAPVGCLCRGCGVAIVVDVLGVVSCRWGRGLGVVL